MKQEQEKRQNDCFQYDEKGKVREQFAQQNGCGAPAETQGKGGSALLLGHERSRQSRRRRKEDDHPQHRRQNLWGSRHSAEREGDGHKRRHGKQQ
jgi:hypothetical protein